MGRTIKWTSRFSRDFKREFKTHGEDLDVILSEVLDFLVSGTPLPAKYRDHKLIGDLGDFRSCHFKPDLILVYEWADDKTLRLARLGSHSKVHGL